MKSVTWWVDQPMSSSRIVSQRREMADLESRFRERIKREGGIGWLESGYRESIGQSVVCFVW